MGTWITFDVNPSGAALTERIAILRAFFRHGGTMIDSSPMYGQAQRVLGAGLKQLPDHPTFAATKIWTSGQDRGIQQAEQSLRLWGVPRFDLLYIHNMLDWEAHLETLRRWRAAGMVAFTGITTSHGRRHRALAAVIRQRLFDVVQFTYNIAEREAEQELLPLAQASGCRVVINRPFRTGVLFQQVADQPLPDWAGEVGINNWAQFFLKFVISHPAVDCAIPATSQLAHMHENMGALNGPLPDAAMRQRMADYFESVRTF